MSQNGNSGEGLENQGGNNRVSKNPGEEEFLWAIELPGPLSKSKSSVDIVNWDSAIIVVDQIILVKIARIGRIGTLQKMELQV